MAPRVSSWAGAMAPSSRVILQVALHGQGAGQDGGQDGGQGDGGGGGGLQLAADCTSHLLTAVTVAGPGQHNSATTPGGPREQQQQDSGNLGLDEFQIIKAVVLGLVTCIILLSICKMVFQLFVRYAGKPEDR